MNSIILSVFHYHRHRSTICAAKVFLVLNFFTFFVSLAFIAEDEYMTGMSMLLQSANMIGVMIFLVLALMLKQ